MDNGEKTRLQNSEMRPARADKLSALRPSRRRCALDGPAMGSILFPMTLPTPESLQPLPRSFFQPDAATVAPMLLGQFLVRRQKEGWAGGRIVEVEAYLSDDPASHSFRGETPRNHTMFARPGIAYVYFIYGQHFCVNAVCGDSGVGEAVLIRAIEVDFGEAQIQRHRAGRAPREWTSGPGRVCAALAIDRSLDGVDLCNHASPLFIGENPDRLGSIAALGPIMTTRRIGLSKAAERLLRFCLKASPMVSRAPSAGRGYSKKKRQS